MGSDWEDINLSQIVDFMPERKIKRGLVAPFIAMADITENYKYVVEKSIKKYTGGGSKFSDGDTLFSRITPCLQNGKCSKVSGLGLGIIGHGSTEFIVLSAKFPKYDSDYIYYLTRLPHFKAYSESRMVGSTGRQRVSWQSLSEYELSVPSPEIRRNIGFILSLFDRKIELNRQMNLTLEGMAQALFKSWFVDFDPVIDNALAAGNPIPDALKAKAAQRDEQLKAAAQRGEAPNAHRELFPAEFTYTEEYGWIPSGWSFKKLGESIDVLNGYAFKSKDYIDSGIFVLRTKNFDPNGRVVLLNDDVYLPPDFEEDYLKYLCEPFDYHLIMVGSSIGNRGLIEPHQLPALRNQNMWCFRPKTKSIFSKTYIKFLLDFITPFKIGLASGSARNFFRKNDFKDHLICHPSIPILNSFEELVFPLLEKQADNNFASSEMAKLRDTLLPKLLSGELQVSEAAGMLEGV